MQDFVKYQEVNSATHSILPVLIMDDISVFKKPL
jgi:hypothetical protein